MMTNKSSNESIIIDASTHEIIATDQPNSSQSQNTRENYTHIHTEQHGFYATFGQKTKKISGLPWWAKLLLLIFGSVLLVIGLGFIILYIFIRAIVRLFRK